MPMCRCWTRWRSAPLPGLQATLVTPYARQMYSGMVPGLLAGHYRRRDCAIPLAPLAAAAGVRLHRSRAVALDARHAPRHAGRRPAARLRAAVHRHRAGDATATPFPVRAEHGLFVRPIEAFVQQLDEHVARAAAQPLQVAVVGGGAAGFELAMALAWRLRRVGDVRSRVTLVSGGAPLAGFAAAGAAARTARAGRAGRGAARRGLRGRSPPTTCNWPTARACPATLPVLAIGAAAPRWLAGSGLALDERGFVATGPTLQSVSHAEVFAAGDVATRVDAPHPKSGVHAVRAGPPLAANLRHRAAGRAAADATAPQQRTLYLLSCGERRAIASWGGWSAEGRWVWRWKDHIDRAFVARYTRAALKARA